LIFGQCRVNRIQEDIKDILQNVSKEMNVSFDIEIINDMGCVYTSSNHPFINLALGTARSMDCQEEHKLGGVNYYTDGSVYKDHLPDVPILIYGPGEPKLAHQPDEWVDINKYMESIKFYIALAIQYLG
jgi:succinyl-diaminopimelate desuccinylase